MPKEYLTSMDEARLRVARRRSNDDVPTTPAVGDPDEDSPAALGHAGAAAGAIIGAAVAGPLGMAVAGGVAGPAAAAAEAGDADAPVEEDRERKEAQLRRWEEQVEDSIDEPT